MNILFYSQTDAPEPWRKALGSRLLRRSKRLLR